MPVEPGQGSDNVTERAVFIETAKAIHAAIGDERCSHDALGDDCWYLARAALAAAVPILLADVAERIRKLAPYNCELRPDGSEDAWVEGIHDAHDVVRSAAARWIK